MSCYNQKFNDEYFENVLADFDFNIDDKIKRKLSIDEFHFLIINHSIEYNTFLGK